MIRRDRHTSLMDTLMPLYKISSKGMIDSLVTPNGIKGLAEGITNVKKNDNANKELSNTSKDSGKTKVVFLRGAKLGYESSSKFSAKIKNKEGETLKFILRREGLTWKLSNVILPLNDLSLPKQRSNKRGIPTKSLSSSVSHSKPSVRAHAGVYVTYANGIVKDTRTGLKWKAGPNKGMAWNQARSWVQSLGGDWRMPTIYELKTLYQEGKGNRNMTPLLKTTGWHVWSGETKGSSAAGGFNFATGNDRSWYSRDNSTNYRAFAVRSRGDG